MNEFVWACVPFRKYSNHLHLLHFNLPFKFLLRYLGLAVHCNLLRRENIYSSWSYSGPSMSGSHRHVSLTIPLPSVSACTSKFRRQHSSVADNFRVTVSLVFLVLWCETLNKLYVNGNQKLILYMNGIWKFKVNTVNPKLLLHAKSRILIFMRSELLNNHMMCF